MKAFFFRLARAFAVIFAVIFVITSIAALLLMNIEARGLEAETYKQAFKSQGLYDRLPTLLAEQISARIADTSCADNPLSCLPANVTPALTNCLQTGLGQAVYDELLGNSRRPGAQELAIIDGCFEQTGTPRPEIVRPPAYLRFLSANDWEILIRELLPASEIEQFISSSLDQVFNFLNGNSNYASISFVPIKNGLETHGVSAIQKLLDAQPDCSLEQANALAALLADPGLTGDQSHILCKPPTLLFDTLNPIIDAAVRAQVTAIPNEIPIFSTANRNIQDLISLARTVMRLSPLLPLAMLFLITLFVVRSFKSWLRWWGIPLAITGSLTFVISIALGPIGQIVLRNALINTRVITGTQLEQTLFDVLSTVIISMAGPIAFQSVVIGLVGLGMVTLSFFAEGWLDSE